MAKYHKYDMTIYQGDTYRRSFEIKDELNNPVDLTNKTLKGQVKKKAGDPVWFELNITVIDSMNGAFTIEHTAAETAVLPVTQISGVYDIQYEDSITGDKRTFMFGSVKVTLEITDL